jgi:hypothetical protein
LVSGSSQWAVISKPNQESIVVRQGDHTPDGFEVTKIDLHGVELRNADPKSKPLKLWVDG